MPPGAASLGTGPSSLVDTVDRAEGIDDDDDVVTAVLSCLRSQGVSRLLERIETSDGGFAGTSITHAAANGDYLALAENGFYYEGSDNYGLQAFDMATSKRTLPTGPVISFQAPPAPGFMCVVGPSEDPGVSPPSPCGINALVVATDGDVAFEATQEAFTSPCEAPGSTTPDSDNPCFTESIVEQTPTAYRTLDAHLSDAPGDASGITGLTVSGNTVTWDDDGVQHDAALDKRRAER